MKKTIISLAILLTVGFCFAKNLQLMQENIQNAQQYQNTSENSQKVSAQSQQLFDQYKKQS
ncbi:endoglucanase [Francisella tularensis subsp. novicida]|uniref:endoglucanase n=1 Tax=Francisella tularensis TaxID=263 RepID=UPI000CE2AB66|nr:endoglucanase [Francisella tularensis]AVC43459.1 endoglucanase [Francisella tularensis subsp. novicida]